MYAFQQRQLKKVSSTPTKRKESSPAVSSSPSKGMYGHLKAAGNIK